MGGRNANAAGRTSGFGLDGESWDTAERVGFPGENWRTAAMANEDAELFFEFRRGRNWWNDRDDLRECLPPIKTAERISPPHFDLSPSRLVP